MGLGCVLGVSAQCPPCRLSDRVLGVPSLTPQAGQALPLCPTKMGTELPQSEPGWGGGWSHCQCALKRGRQRKQTELLFTGNRALLCARLCSALPGGHCEQTKRVQVPGGEYVGGLRFKPVSGDTEPRLWEGQCGKELREPWWRLEPTICGCGTPAGCRTYS